MGGRILVPLVLAAGLALSASASAGVPLTKVSEDPYSNSESQHKTQVGADTFSFRSTIVAVAQAGRFHDGGASNIAWGTSQDGGSTWTDGVLPHTTVYAGGPWSRIGDPAIAYDDLHDVWLAASIGFIGSRGAAVLVSRSTDGGLTWGDPIVVDQSSGFYEKSWTSCDNTPTSSFYGRCYTKWQNAAQGNRILNSRSTDGGLTWSRPRGTRDDGSGVGGLPVVKPNGDVVVLVTSADFTGILEYRSKNGGKGWGLMKLAASIIDHVPAGGLRAFPLPSADVDAAGNVYVVWQDCRFRTGCSSNDIVLTVNKKYRIWESIVRIPIDSLGSGVDHFLPGLAVEPGTSGRNAHLALTYYYYRDADCSFATCELHVGFVESPDGGQTWTAPVDVAGPMNLSWLPDTASGRMVGDYVSTSFRDGQGTHAAFAVAKAPTGGVFDQATYTTAAPLFGLRPANRPVTPADRIPVTDTSDHPPYSLVTLN